SAFRHQIESVASSASPKVAGANAGAAPSIVATVAPAGRSGVVTSGPERPLGSTARGCGLAEGRAAGTAGGVVPEAPAAAGAGAGAAGGGGGGGGGGGAALTTGSGVATGGGGTRTAGPRPPSPGPRASSRGSAIPGSRQPPSSVWPSEGGGTVDLRPSGFTDGAATCFPDSGGGVWRGALSSS